MEYLSLLESKTNRLSCSCGLVHPNVVSGNFGFKNSHGTRYRNICKGDRTIQVLWKRTKTLCSYFMQATVHRYGKQVLIDGF